MPRISHSLRLLTHQNRPCFKKKRTFSLSSIHKNFQIYKNVLKMTATFMLLSLISATLGISLNMIHPKDSTIQSLNTGNLHTRNNETLDTLQNNSSHFQHVFAYLEVFMYRWETECSFCLVEFHWINWLASIHGWLFRSLYSIEYICSYELFMGQWPLRAIDILENCFYRTK
jgi:hypothetical protein